MIVITFECFPFSRLAICNASSAACVNPGIETEVAALDIDSPVLLASVSHEMEGFVFMTVITATHAQ